MTVHLATSDNFSGVAATAFGESPFDCAGAEFVHAPSGDVSYTLSDGDGSKVLYVCALDVAGNLSGTDAFGPTNALELDTADPVAPTFTLPPWSTNAFITVFSVTAPAETGESRPSRVRWIYRRVVS